MDFENLQSSLVTSVNEGNSHFIFIDSDGTLGDWIAVVIESKTGVIYGTQCRGTATEERYIEGFFIPCGGLSFDTNDLLKVTSVMLTALFHTSKNGCLYNLVGKTLPESKIDKIANTIKQIPLWHYTNINDCTRDHLELDFDRVYEICEAWIPIKTKFGRGVLLWNNCD